MFLAKFSAFVRLFHQFIIDFKKCPTYFSILPLVLNRVSWFRIGFNLCPAYFSILPLAFSKCPNYFMILPLVLIKFKPMPIFCHCFPSNCTTYFSISIGLQSLFRIFQHLTVGVHLFFPLPGLVFISFFLPFFVSSTFIIVSLFFSFFIFSHVHFVHHLLSFWHCVYMVFIVIYCIINFDHV